MVSYEIRDPGVYAVIFKPIQMKDEEFCGMVCRYSRELVFIGIVVIPGLLLFNYLLWKVLLLITSMGYEDYKMAIAREQMKAMENLNTDYKGQKLKDKIENRITEVSNPVLKYSAEEREQLVSLNQEVEKLRVRKHHLKEERKFLNGKTRKLIEEVKEGRRAKRMKGVRAFGEIMFNLGSPN